MATNPCKQTIAFIVDFNKNARFAAYWNATT
jgi:hypothetical protein